MICQRCNEEVPVSPGQKILTCDPVYSPYLKRNQLTTLIKHTHTGLVESFVGYTRTSDA